MGSKRRIEKPQSKVRQLADRQFIDGLDRYANEYARWRRGDIVKGLLGIFELPVEQFQSASLEKVVKLVGLGHCTPLYYNANVEQAPRDFSTGTGTGYCFAARDHYGKVRPIVVLRENVNIVTSNAEEEANREEMAAAIRLLVLMHELGHADDIARSVNYNHENLSLDLVAAEAYAHAFVCRHAKRIGYRLALAQYLCNIEDGLTSTDDSIRLPAKVASETLDIAALKEFASIDGPIEARLRRAGRREEVKRHFQRQNGG